LARQRYECPDCHTRFDALPDTIWSCMATVRVILLDSKCGKAAATTTPSAQRDPQPLAGRTHTPDCPAWAQAAGFPPTEAPSTPPPRMILPRGRRRHGDPPGHCSP
jgi:hypothetical protein